MVSGVKVIGYLTVVMKLCS